MNDLEKKLREAASTVQQRWDMGGLSGTMYEDYAVEIAQEVFPAALREAETAAYEKAAQVAGPGPMEAWSEDAMWASHRIQKAIRALKGKGE